jgi:hypothetical protein
LPYFAWDFARVRMQPASPSEQVHAAHPRQLSVAPKLHHVLDRPVSLLIIDEKEKTEDVDIHSYTVLTTTSYSPDKYGLYASIPPPF